MRRIALTVLVSALLMATAVDASAGTRHNATPKCSPGHSHLIAADTQAEVYIAVEPHEGTSNAYGCAYGHTPRVLGEVTGCESPHGCRGVASEMVAGPLVAYEEFSLGELEHHWYVVVRDLRNGRVLRKVPTGAAPASWASEGVFVGTGNAVAIVVKSDGAVAWITSNRNVLVGAPEDYEVHAADKSGSRLLAGPTAEIAPHSLALAGSILYWTQGGKPMSASLN